MRLPLSIAVRFLKSSKLQTFMIVLGISVGVSVQVFIGSLITGLQNSLIDKTIGSSSHVTVQPASKGVYIDEYQRIIDQVKASDGLIEVVSPSLDSIGTMENNGVTESIVLRGFDFQVANQIYQFDERLVEGQLPNQINEIMIGIELKAQLKIELNDTVHFQLPLINETAEVQTFKVVGFFDFNVSSVNKTWVVSQLSTVQNVTNIGDKISSIEMQLLDVFAAEDVNLAVEKALNDPNLIVTDWMKLNAELLSGLQGQSTSSLMIQVFVLISVVLGISSVLAITVLQKSKQIGILKAMGIKDFDASLIFLFEGLILGILGAIGGVLLGLGLSYVFTTFALKPNGEPVVPLFIDPVFIGYSALIATMASTLASLIPARKSSKLSVIEVIRNA